MLTSTNVTIENNWFDKPWPDGSSAIQFSEPDSGGTYANVMIRNNSFGGTLMVKDEVAYPNLRVIANVGTSYGGHCGSGRRRTTSGPEAAAAEPIGGPIQAFGIRRGFDFHLKPGAAAINRGHPSSFPRVDIDGQRRPFGRRSDAGADEARIRGG